MSEIYGEQFIQSDFEPSVNTKTRWLSVRKHKYEINNRSFPGLFSTKGYDVDRIAFGTVIFLEAWGLYNLLIAIGMINAYTVGAAVALMMIDISLALLRHIPVGKKNLFENRWLIENETILSDKTRPKGVPIQEEKDYNKVKWLSWLCAVLILFIALAKILLFYFVDDEITGITISVIVSYLFAALLHIYCTGYYIAGLFFKRTLKRDFKAWRNEENKTSHNFVRPFEIVVSLDNVSKLIAKVTGDHKIEKRGEKWMLETRKILTDGQLREIVGNQDKELQYEIALNCLKAQLWILTSPPVAHPVKTIGHEHTDTPSQIDNVMKDDVVQSEKGK